MKNIAELEKYSLEEIENELRKRSNNKDSKSLDDRSLSSVLDQFQDSELLETVRNKQRVIYGNDDRTDLYLVEDSNIQNDADSVVAIFKKSKITDNGDGTSTIQTEKFAERYKLCQSEKFRDQPSSCDCSGFLVGSDLVVTAGHCVDPNNPDSIRLLFGYKMNNKTATQTKIDNNEIYSVKEVIGYMLDPEEPNSRLSDWAIVRLDRSVDNHNIARINRNIINDNQKIHVIGHPCGIPIKYAGNARVKNNSPDAYFVANTDTYGGNSGSPIFNSDNHEIEGILVRGEPDFRATQNSCQVSMVCPVIGENPSCEGEHCTRTKEFIQHIST